MVDSIGIAVIGAGMAGKAHIAAYRAAPTVYGSDLPPLRYVSIGDTYEPLGTATAKRYGFERHDSDWRAIAAADDIDVVSVVVANRLHREIVEGLLAAGKHVLCEKPLTDTLEDARAMVAAAEAAEAKGTIARIGFTNLRAPAIAAIQKLIADGTLGNPIHTSGRYLTDYACDPHAPMSWRYKGPQGSGSLADLGSHLLYVAEFFAGPIREVSGGRFVTQIAHRPLPLGQVVGHEHVEVSEFTEPVENDDYAAFTARFEHGGGVIETSRIAPGLPNSMQIEVYCERGAAKFDLQRPGEFELFLPGDPQGVNGYRTVVVGNAHPYFSGGFAMDAPGVSLGHNDSFVFQARAFLDEVAGVPADRALPRTATLADGLHNMEIIAAVAESAAANGAAVRLVEKVATQ